MLFSKALEGFEFSRLSEGYSKNSLIRYRCCLNQLISYLGDNNVDDVTERDLQSFSCGYAMIMSLNAPSKISPRQRLYTPFPL